MADRAEHDGQALGTRQVIHACSRLIHHLQRMHPDVAFGVPFGFLHAADERVEFREEPLDDTEVEREGQSNRRPRRHEQLLDFAPDAFGGKVVERDRQADRA